MRYFITLNDQEFRFEPSATGDSSFDLHAVGDTGTREPVSVEILAPAATGAPALLRVGSRIFRVALDRPAPSAQGTKDWSARIDGHVVRVGVQSELERRSERRASATHASAAVIRAPLPGRVLKIAVATGARVVSGAPLLTIEAMKMENEIVSPRAGRVTRVTVEAGAAVDADAELLTIEEE